MKTIKFFASLGVNAGYGHQNENSSPSETVSQVWQKIAEEYLNETGIYISVVICDSKTVYSTKWGCPIGGENTVLITGECNPKYTEISTYQTAVTEVLKKVAAQLVQSTTQVTFQEVEFVYLGSHQ